LYCQYCGMQLDDAAFYCSRCGKPTAPNPPGLSSSAPIAAPQGPSSAAPADAAQSPSGPIQALSSNVRMLGILWPLYSMFRLIFIAWGIFSGRMMPRIWIRSWPPQVNPYRFAPIVHGIVVTAIVWGVVVSLLGIGAGLALLRRGRAGRMIALVAAFLSLISIPFGTALGIYTLVVLLSEGANRDYARLASSS
jgi:hypothetical protein